MIQQDALMMVFSRNQFYRRQYHLAFFAFLLSVLVIIVLCGVTYFLLKNPTPPVYFATDTAGRLIPIVPVDQPGMSDDQAAQFAVDAVMKTYSYDYLNYHGQLQDTQKYFTNYGWTNYLKTLTASNYLVAVRERQMISVPAVVNTPQLINRGLLGGKFAWKFQMPLLVTYLMPPYDAKLKPDSKFVNAYTVDVIIQRQPILQSYRGLGVVQMISTFANTATPNQLNYSGTGQQPGS